MVDRYGYYPQLPAIEVMMRKIIIMNMVEVMMQRLAILFMKRKLIPDHYQKAAAENSECCTV